VLEETARERGGSQARRGHGVGGGLSGVTGRRGERPGLQARARRRRRPERRHRLGRRGEGQASRTPDVSAFFYLRMHNDNNALSIWLLELICMCVFVDVLIRLIVELS
jgi:hypothetical protein